MVLLFLISSTIFVGYASGLFYIVRTLMRVLRSQVTKELDLLTLSFPSLLSVHHLIMARGMTRKRPLFD